MKILLTGAAGQLGHELQKSLAPLGELHAFDRCTLDLADPDAIARTLREIGPDLIVNAAAYTAVDKAENDTAAALAINVTAPDLLATEAKKTGARLIHYSTDYVFNGEGTKPWLETDTVAPINVYGGTKWAGEQAIINSGCRHLILRTSWVFGLHGANFMNTMLRLARERDSLGIVADQHGAPTWTRHLAQATVQLARIPDAHGLYHLANAGQTTWADYAEAIFAEAVRLGLLPQAPTIRRLTSADFPTPAKRPSNSRLDCSRIARDYGVVMPDWRHALTACLANAPR
jgi:dTDP-4-dehydrorhamnose reductase